MKVKVQTTVKFTMESLKVILSSCLKKKGFHNVKDFRANLKKVTDTNDRDCYAYEVFDCIEATAEIEMVEED
jgi:hypothetical protein